MPTCPIEMPSETLIVPNSSGYLPAACTPSLTAFASRSRDRLHGVISFQMDPTPICGLAQSASPMPTARSMPRDPVASSPSVTTRLRGLMSGVLFGGVLLDMGLTVWPRVQMPSATPYRLARCEFVQQGFDICEAGSRWPV